MKIIGVGCGPGLLTGEAIRELKKARFAYGSDRAIELARSHLPENCTVRSIDDYKKPGTLPENAVILSTGDPMLAGLGYLKGEVIPGISSLQVAAARLHIPLSRVVVVVAHGRGHRQAMQDTVDEVKRKRIVFLLADPKFDVSELYRQLAGTGIPLQIGLCENLAYPDERVVVSSLSSPPVPASGLYSLLIGDF